MSYGTSQSLPYVAAIQRAAEAQHHFLITVEAVISFQVIDAGGDEFKPCSFDFGNMRVHGVKGICLGTIITEMRKARRRRSEP